MTGPAPWGRNVVAQGHQILRLSGVGCHHWDTPGARLNRQSTHAHCMSATVNVMASRPLTRKDSLPRSRRLPNSLRQLYFRKRHRPFRPRARLARVQCRARMARATVLAACCYCRSFTSLAAMPSQTLPMIGIRHGHQEFNARQATLIFVQPVIESVRPAGASD